MSFALDIVGIDAAFDLLEDLKVRYEDVDDAVYITAPTVNYAVEQERGTSDISARPYMRPAAERARQDPEGMLAKYDAAAPNAGPVETLAIAVQNEAKQIADRKGVRDTGALINSITYREV